METPWETLASLDPDNRRQAFDILSADEHQLLEGLVVENTFDQILRPLTASPPHLLALDVETVIADTRRPGDKWLAIVRARDPKGTVGLGRLPVRAEPCCASAARPIRWR